MTGTTRRALLAGLAASPFAAGAAGAVRAEGPEERLMLWPGVPPGAPATLPVPKVEQRSNDPAVQIRWLTGVDRPWLTVYRPARPNGAAMIVIPGGGYRFLSWDREGVAPARWLAELGVTAFVLGYRLPGEGWAGRATVPLSDAQRAIRLVRSRAAAFGVDPARIGVIGFSAGGHLAGSLATRHSEPAYVAVDAADALPARPELAALIYPVVTLAEPFAHSGSRDLLLGPGADAAVVQHASVDQRVDAQTPPCFLLHAADDKTVPVENSLMLHAALRAAGRPAALHLFEDGGHGFGLHLRPAKQAAIWPTLFARFAVAHGLFPAA